MQRGIRRKGDTSNCHFDEEAIARTAQWKDRRRRKQGWQFALLTIFSALLAVILLVCSATIGAKRYNKSLMSQGDAKITASLPSPKLTTTNTTLVECKISTIESSSGSTANGVWRITVYNEAPCAQIFLGLVADGYYNNAYLFRVIRGFVAQFGFVHPAPNLQRWKTQKSQEDQMAKNYKGRLSNTRGTLTMIKGDVPQVFLNLGNNRRLDKDKTFPFGIVDDDSMDIADKLHTGYQPGQGQIPAIKNGTVSMLFPKMSKVEQCYVANPS